MALFTSMFANKALSVRAEGQPTHDAHLEGEKTIQKAVNRQAATPALCKDALNAAQSRAASFMALTLPAFAQDCSLVCLPCYLSLCTTFYQWKGALQTKLGT